MTVFDTIAAECTAPYKAALSVIRMSGPDSFSILGKVIKKDVKSLEFRKAYYCGIYQENGSLIDRGLVILFKGKESFAGEDSVEFYVHGSRIIVNQLLDALVRLGARRAEGGEFSFKAFMNGKMDLTQAEAVNNLINARTVRSKEYALESISGTSSKKLKDIKEKLNLLEAEIETDIDYPEFDQEADLKNKVLSIIPGLLEQTKKLESGSKQSEYLFNGIKVAIIGEPNVGKSTLLNKILNQEKAIVTPIPGTTRDVVEGEKEINGIIYKFFDTAGIRKRASSIEEIGIEKTYKAALESDIILMLTDKGLDIQSEEKKLGLSEEALKKPTIYVSTKSDIRGIDAKADVSISKDDKDLDKLYSLIEKKLDISKDQNDGFSSKRDLDLLSEFNRILSSVITDLNDQMTIDVAEIKLIEASRCLDEILGVEQTMEDIYKTVFQHFCVGK